MGDGGAVEKWVPFGAILGGRKKWFDEFVMWSGRESRLKDD